MDNLICSCGNYMVSDGITWRCAYHGIVGQQCGAERHDKRVLRNLAKTTLQREGIPGPPGGRSRVRHRVRIVRRKRIKLPSWKVPVNPVWAIFEQLERENRRKR